MATSDKNDNGWYNERQQITMSGKANDNEWYSK